MSEGCQRRGSVSESTALLLKKTFQKFDLDSSGTIDRKELEKLLDAILPADGKLDAQEMDQLFLSLDQGGQGEIEYDRLIDWVTVPSAHLRATATGGLEFFDLAAALEPLFVVYDRNSDGFISVDEFLEVHGVLQNALLLNDASKDLELTIFRKGFGKCFKDVDKSNDRRISFEEFVEWQRSALAESGLGHGSLQKLLSNLARHLQRIYRYSEAEKQGELTDVDKRILMRILANIANFSRDLWNNKATPQCQPRHGFKNTWLEPTAGMSVERLRSAFLRDFRPSLFGEKIKSIDVRVFCAPELPEREDKDRIWLARVERTITYPSGRQVSSESAYYNYDKECMNWHLTQNGVSFQAAVQGLSKEMQLFCVLKTSANFGRTLSWGELQEALSCAVSWDIITEETQTRHNECVEDVLLKSLKDEGYDERDYTKMLEPLKGNLRLSPSTVMVTLSEMGVFKMTSIWADFIEL